MATFKEIVDAAAEHWVVSVLTALILAGAVIARSSIMSLLNVAFAKVCVAGKWQTKLVRNGVENDHEQVDLHQCLQWVWGQARTLEVKPKTYGVRGSLRGQMLCLTYSQTTDPGFESGAILLQVNVDGRQMKGYEVGYDPTKEAISADQYKWHRL